MRFHAPVAVAPGFRPQAWIRSHRGHQAQTKGGSKRCLSNDDSSQRAKTQLFADRAPRRWRDDGRAVFLGGGRRRRRPRDGRARAPTRRRTVLFDDDDDDDDSGELRPTGAVVVDLDDDDHEQAQAGRSLRLVLLELHAELVWKSISARCSKFSERAPVEILISHRRGNTSSRGPTPRPLLHFATDDDEPLSPIKRTRLSF